MCFLYRFLAAVCLLIGAGSAAIGQTLDPNFAPSSLTVPVGGIQALLKQPDGKVLISTAFHLLNGQPSPRVARLNADGSPDLAFRAQAGSGPNTSIIALALQADGKILLGGEYGVDGYNGMPVQNIIRLNPDGSLDATFSSGGLGWRGSVRTIAVQPDGKILVGGSLLSTFNGQPTNGLVRLLPNGQPDTGFVIGTGFSHPFPQSSEVRKILIQPDGNIVAIGNFISVNGQPRNAIVRLTPTGSVDATFTSPFSTNAYPLDVVIQPDGRLVVGGTQVGISNTTNLLRLLPNGTPDASFTVSLNQGTVLSLVLRSDGSLLVAGSFNSIGGLMRGGLARVSSTGTVDATFAAGGGTNNGSILNVAELNNGQYLASGYFGTFDGQATNGLVRLQSNGQLDASYALLLENIVSGPLMPLANGQVALAYYGQFNFNGQVAGSPVGTQLHLVNNNGSYNGTLTFPAALPRPAGGSYYRDIMLQPDGTAYATYQDTDTTLLVRRILTNGTFDPAYTSARLHFGTQTQYPLCCGGAIITPVAGGQLLVRGAFGRVNGQPRRYLARLNADGTLNTTFAPPTNAVWQVPFAGVGSNPGLRNAYGLANGQTLVVWNDATRSYIARLNLDGSLDNTYSIGNGGGPNALFSVLPLASGKVLAYGDFTTFNGQATPYGVVRLLANGAPDTSFVAASALANAVEQPDGRLLVIAPGNNPQTQRLVRLTDAGSFDTSFQPVAILNESFQRAAAVVYLQPSINAILLGGDFTRVAGQPRFGLARLVNTPLAVRSPTAAPVAEVFPNPAHEQLSLHLPAAPTGPATLTDLQGRTVRRYTLARASTDNLSVRGLAPGLYLLSVPTTAGTTRQRLVVE